MVPVKRGNLCKLLPERHASPGDKTGHTDLGLEDTFLGAGCGCMLTTLYCGAGKALADASSYRIDPYPFGPCHLGPLIEVELIFRTFLTPSSYA